MGRAAEQGVQTLRQPPPKTHSGLWVLFALSGAAFERFDSLGLLNTRERTAGGNDLSARLSKGNQTDPADSCHQLTPTPLASPAGRTKKKAGGGGGMSVGR